MLSTAVAITTKSTAHEPQRDGFGGRQGNAALSADACNLQAVAADLRQAADLLSADHVDDGRHPRTPDYHDARRDRPVQTPARRRQAMGDRTVLCYTGTSRRNRGSIPDRPRVSRRPTLGTDPR